MTKQTEELVSNMTKHIEEHVSNTDHQVSNHIYFAVGGEATGVAMGLLIVGLEVQRQARWTSLALSQKLKPSVKPNPLIHS